MRRRSFLLLSGGLAAGVAIFLGCGKDEESGTSPKVDAGNAADTSTPIVADGGAPDASTWAAPFDWVGVIGTGQSLSIGATAGNLSTTPSFNNGKLVDNGPAPKYPLDGGGASYAVVPLVEPIRTGINNTGGQYPGNIAGETPHSGMASELTFLAKRAHGAADYVSMHTVVGWSGHPLKDINKQGTGTAYPGSIQEVRAFTQLAKAAGKTYGVGGIILTHGETDARDNNTAYGQGLKTLIADYNTDVKAITGQTRDIKLLVSQQSVLPGPSAVLVWQAGNEDPNIVCVGPKYQYVYSDDLLHFQAPGYLRLGEKYAEVFDVVVNQGKTWKPLQPRSITRSEKVITIVFDVPNAPLQWDTTLAPPHQAQHTAWAAGHGFEVLDGANEAKIVSAELAAADTVKLTLESVPVSTVTVGYATTADQVGNKGGTPDGYTGQLADSDPLVGADEEPLDVVLTQGSETVALATGASFAKRAVRDIVTGAGAPSNWTVLGAAGGNLRMSAKWTGATGPATVKIHHDLRNYAVHFSQQLP